MTREEAAEMIKNDMRLHHDYLSGEYRKALKLAISALKQPEIIRCKDCKYYAIHTLFGRSQGWCERLCDEFDKSLARGTEANDFCSRAERRTDESND